MNSEPPLVPPTGLLLYDIEELVDAIGTIECLLSEVRTECWLELTDTEMKAFSDMRPQIYSLQKTLKNLARQIKARARARGDNENERHDETDFDASRVVDARTV